LCYYNDDYQRSNRSSNSCCNRQSLARMGWWCYCRWVCPNITRTFFFLLPSSLHIILLPCFSHCDGPPIHLFEHYSSSQSTRFATRKKNTLQGKPTSFKLPFPTFSKLLVQIYESSLSSLSSFVPPLHHLEHQMQ